MTVKKKLQGAKLNAKVVKIAMLQLDLKMEDLAKALALSKLSVSARLNGRTPCRILELEKLSEVLRIPVEVLALPPEQTPPAAPPAA